MSIRRLAATGILILGGCSPDPRDTEVLNTTSSPDGALEAVYADDIGGGAAVGVTQEVFVIKNGTAFRPRLSERVFSAECAEDIVVAWERSGALRISYPVPPGAHAAPGVHPSPSSLLQSGYWIFSRPHGVQVRYIEVRTPGSGGC